MTTATETTVRTWGERYPFGWAYRFRLRYKESAFNQMRRERVSRLSPPGHAYRFRMHCRAMKGYQQRMAEIKGRCPRRWSNALEVQR